MTPALRRTHSGFFEISTAGLGIAVAVFTLLSAVVTVTISYTTTRLAIAQKLDIWTFNAAIAERRSAMDTTRLRIAEDHQVLLEIRETLAEVSVRQTEMVCDLLKTKARYCR